MANGIYEFVMSDFHIVTSNFRLKGDKEYDLGKIFDLAVTLNMKHEFIAEDNALKLSMTVEIIGDEMPFTLAIEGASLFTFNNRIEDPSELDQVAQINCASITFPYLREVVADTVRRSGLPPLHLPPVNFIEIYKQKQDGLAPDVGGKISG